MKKQNHPADEKRSSVFIHLWLPVCAACLVLVVSLIVDLLRIRGYWSQRAGAIVTVIGAYIAYYESRASMKFIEGSLFINMELPYKIASLLLVVFGTFLWGYGDLLVNVLLDVC